ncbi:MAG: non-canonical purine NTP pyrophosphatase [Nanoarchaeota archaeon]
MQRILIGTNNHAKVERWQQTLGMYAIVTPAQLGLIVNVKEGMISVIENSQTKAKMYAKASGLVTISQDDAFYIDALGGLPGIAVRRWGGALPDNVSDEDWLAYFRSKIAHLDNLRGHFEIAVSVANPHGDVKTRTYTRPGTIDPSKLDAPHSQGYPISASFVRDGINKTWHEMNLEEQMQYNADMTIYVKDAITALTR